jgi:hypothetical protein
MSGAQAVLGKEGSIYKAPTKSSSQTGMHYYPTFEFGLNLGMTRPFLIGG